MESEVNDCTKKLNPKHVAMDEYEYNEHVNYLRNSRERIERKFAEWKASRLKAVDVQAEKSNHQISIMKEKSSETPVKVKKVEEVEDPKIEALAVEKVDAVDDIDVGESLVKAADTCGQD